MLHGRAHLRQLRVGRFAARILDRENPHREPTLLQGENLVQDKRLRQPWPRADHVSDRRPLLRLKLHKLLHGQALRGDRPPPWLHPSEELRYQPGNRFSSSPPPAAAPAFPEKGPLDRAHRSSPSERTAWLWSFALRWVRCGARQGPSSSGTPPQTTCCSQPCRPPERPQRCNSDCHPHRERFEPAVLLPPPPTQDEFRAGHSPPLP